MDYSMDEIKISNKILYYLLKNKELKENEEELYKAYSENENIAELVKVAGEEYIILRQDDILAIVE